VHKSFRLEKYAIMTPFLHAILYAVPRHNARSPLDHVAHAPPLCGISGTGRLPADIHTFTNYKLARRRVQSHCVCLSGPRSYS
jgi:hypothetical protein